MRAEEIEVGRIYRMRYLPVLRMSAARVVARLDDGSFEVEPFRCVREYDDRLVYGPANFEEEWND